MLGRVVSLHIYPVKSCAGLDFQSLRIGPRGPRFDREWMVIDEATRGFLTQRELGALTQVKTHLTGSSLIVSIPQKNGGFTEVSVPLQEEDLNTIEVKVWKDTCRAQEAAPLASEALSQFLGKRVRLVRMAPGFERQLDTQWGVSGAHTGFADGFPILMTSLNSLTELNSRLKTPVPMNRFRPNIVIETTAPFAEDSWKKIKIGDMNLEVVKPCARCVMITADQLTGHRDPEPLKVLSEYRRTDAGKVIFGQNLIHWSSGQIKVGDLIS